MPLSRKEREIMKASKVPNKNGKSVMSTRSGESNKSDIQVNQTTGGIVKTVLLPFDQINNLKNELEHLKQYKAAQKALFEESIQGYQKDKVIRLQEAQLRENDYGNSI